MAQCLKCGGTHYGPGECAWCRGDQVGMVNQLAAQQNVGAGGLGNGSQPAIEAMERAAYERGVAEERRRIERAIAHVQSAIDKAEDAPMSAAAHLDEARALLTAALDELGP
jgi:hypothetical protein